MISKMSDLFEGDTPPYPLPGYIEEQIEQGYRAIELLKQVNLEISRQVGVDSPWLPEYLATEIGEFVSSQA